MQKIEELQEVIAQLKAENEELQRIARDSIAALGNLINAIKEAQGEPVASRSNPASAEGAQQA